MQTKTIFLRIAVLTLWVALAVSCRARGTTQVAEFSADTQELPASITVVNWNSQKGNHPRFVSDLKTLLERERPDIVFLQEATAEMLEPDRMGGYFANSWRYPWPGGGATGVVTLSRVAPKRIEPIPTRYGELGTSVPKVSLVAEYPLSNGQRLLTVNVHLLNFERWSVRKISHQLEELKSIISRHSGPILMAGDFNTWNRKRLEIVKKITQDLRLQEVTDFPEGRKTGGRKSEFWNGVLGVDKNLPLDRVFFFGLHPRSARVLDVHSSDHRPILVRLEVDS